MTAGPIAMAHVQSSHHCIKRAIMSHYLTRLAIIIQQSHIDRDISQNLLRLDRTTITLVHASFVQLLFVFTCDYVGSSSRSIFGRTKNLVAFVLPPPTVKMTLSVKTVCGF